MPLFLDKTLPREDAWAGISFRAIHPRAAWHGVPCLVRIPPG